MTENKQEFTPGDQKREAKQREKVFRVMEQGNWRTLIEIEMLTGEPQASISARLRDFRKPRFGGWIVDRERVFDGSGQFQYRLRKPSEENGEYKETA